MKKIAIKPSFTDDRGDIIDLIGDDEINAVTLVTFKVGAVRANHYHKKTYQWNYVIKGRIRIVSQMPSESTVESVMEPGDFIVTSPMESHALEALEDSEVLILTKGPRAGDAYESDTFRLDVPLIENKR